MLDRLPHGEHLSVHKSNLDRPDNRPRGGGKNSPAGDRQLIDATTPDPALTLCRAAPKGSGAASFLVLAPLVLALAAALHAGTFVAYGPESFARTTADPIDVTRSFAIKNPNTTYTLRVANGGFKGEFDKLVSSGVIALNGAPVVTQNDFNQNVALIEKPVTLLAKNELTIQLQSAPGSGISIEIIGVDNDPPVITAAASPLPNAAGWNNSNVTVAFTCSDPTSNVEVCPAPVVVSTEGAKQVISGTARDQAGNAASASVTVNLDKTPPLISAAGAPLPNAAGWNNSNVTAVFTCTDALSGIEFCEPPAVISAEGASQVASGTARDRAGNAASASLTVKLDKTPPTLSIISPANGTTLATPSASVTGSVADSLSGLVGVRCAATDASILSGSFTCLHPRPGHEQHHRNRHGRCG